jgi:hypothetical protein
MIVDKWIKRIGIGFVLSLVVIFGFAISSGASARELYRIRVVNADGGPVEVSADGGSTYHRVGQVTRGTASIMRGYAASVYGVPGTVCATAVHGIRIKVGGCRDCARQEAKVISIIPREFAVAPKGFGGHIAGDSGIYTDIPAGTSIFRNLSPLVGNHVFRESSAGLLALEDGYLPTRGDVLVIKVEVPDRYPSEIEIENAYGGKVTAIYPDGRKEEIAKVDRPVRGIGRFDATGYTGIGRINTNHTGVITISTAPLVSGAKDGSGIETRGGFMIQPCRHAKSAGEYWQVMVVGPVSPKAPWLEGSAPLFSGYFSLAWYPTDPKHSTQVRVRTNSSGWMDLPPMVGLDNQALMHLPGGKGAVTGIRIEMPRFSEELSNGEILRCSAEYEESRRLKAISNGTLIRSGAFTIDLDPSQSTGVKAVNLYLDGVFRGFSNSPPYCFSLDARGLDDGEHTAWLSGVDSRGATITRLVRSFYVQKSKGG